MNDSERRAFTEAELKVIFTEAVKAVPPLHRLFTVLLFTGLRLGDGACLRWENIDLGRGFILLTPQKVKRFGARAAVKIPILPPLRAMLEEVAPDKRTGFVLPGMAAHYRSDTLSKIVSTFLKKKCRFDTYTETSGRKRVVLSAHSFRHSFVSLAANAGVPFALVQRVVGHQTAQMSSHYFHETEAATTAAFKAFPTLGLATGAPQIENKADVPAARDTIDAVATVKPLSRIEELRRVVQAIAEDGDRAEIAAAREVLAVLGASAR